MTENVEHPLNQIAVARSEIRNLRYQIASLKQEQQKAVSYINSTLAGLRCASCAVNEASTQVNQRVNDQPVSDDSCIKYKPIGVIETSFQNKRAVPRQPSASQSAGALMGTVVIDPTVFNNPEHALNSLEEFSHIWIVFHFHMTESKKVLAKVAPPRLGGEKRGVFSTRSPHRPCPIGLSLVKLHSIEGNRINFLGVDMVNGTPVLDIKPYIPTYDHPSAFLDTRSTRPPTEGLGGDAPDLGNLTLDDDGVDSMSLSPQVMHSLGIDTSPSNSPLEDIPSPGNTILTPVSPATDSPSSLELLEADRAPARHMDYERGAPDGQERFTPPSTAHVNVNEGVRIASWIPNPPTQVYEVKFTDDALQRLTNLIGDRAPSFKSTLEGLLAEDPRSLYVRTRYPEHEYNCVLEDLCISCVFDSSSKVCTVIALKGAEDLQ